MVFMILRVLASIDDLVALGVDEVRHVGSLGCSNQGLAVGADTDALGLDADWHLRHDLALGGIDRGHQSVVLVGDIDRTP
jgi:hypothetical protein